MDAAQHNAATAGISPEELSNFTSEGASRAKFLLLTFVEQGGKLGNISVPHHHCSELVSTELPAVLRSAIKRQTDHVRRTQLSVARVQALVLNQLAGNDCGLFCELLH